MFKTRDYDGLVDLMGRSLTETEHDFMEDTMSPNTQHYRLIDELSGKDFDEESQEALIFTGDDRAGPPLAWVLLWGGKYSNICGEVVPPDLSRHEYVMWNQWRLNVEGTREYFARLWDESPELIKIKEYCPWWRDAFGIP